MLQLSVAVTLAGAGTASHSTVILSGTTIVGSVTSSTVTENVLIDTPTALVAVVVTVVVPTGKKLPGADE